MNDPAAHTRDILQRSRELDFALAGVTRATPSRRADAFRAWLRAGHHGEMAYMARNVDVRVDPQVLLPGARSVICVADRYHDGSSDAPAPGGEGPAGRIARYARGEDYHKVMRKRLHTLCDALRETYPDEQFRACVDTAPILEREFAARAGLGARGKHTLLIEQGVGSYLLLGEVVTTLKMEVEEMPGGLDPCETCTRCIDACPTGAISPWSVDARVCISYLTIEHRGRIDAKLHEAMGDWIFGCDVCQEVCPHNQPTERTQSASVHEAYAPRRASFDLLEVMNWDEDARRAAFTKSAMKRAKLGMMRRNAIIAAGNALSDRDDDRLREGIESIAADAGEDPLVRETAKDVLARLNGMA